LSDGNVAKLAGQARWASNELAVHDHGSADAFGDGDYDEVAGTLRQVAMPEFSQGAGIGSIFELDRKACRALERRLQIHISPAEVGSEHQTLGGGIQATRDADPNAFVEKVWMGGHHVAQAATKKSHELGWVRTCRKRAMGSETGVDASDDERGSIGADIDTEDCGTFGVETEEGWFASTGQVTEWSFCDPSFLD
jgi:hypothetical protein